LSVKKLLTVVAMMNSDIILYLRDIKETTLLLNIIALMLGIGF